MDGKKTNLVFCARKLNHFGCLCTQIYPFWWFSHGKTTTLVCFPCSPMGEKPFWFMNLYDKWALKKFPTKNCGIFLTTSITLFVFTYKGGHRKFFVRCRVGRKFFSMRRVGHENIFRYKSFDSTPSQIITGP